MFEVDVKNMMEKGREGEGPGNVFYWMYFVSVSGVFLFCTWSLCRNIFRTENSGLPEKSHEQWTHGVTCQSKIENSARN